MPTVRLTWTDPNIGVAQEDEIRIYRSTSPFDAGSLPPVLATLAANTLTYDDTTAVDGSTYYYAVGMVKGTIVQLSFGQIDVGGLVVKLDVALSRPQLTIASDGLSFVSSMDGLFGARTKFSRRTGKFYFEVSLTDTAKGGDGFCMVGLARPDLTFEAVGRSAYGVWINLASTSNGNIWIEGTNTALNLGIAADGDRYGFAIDLDANLVWARRNNGNWNASGTANPATGTGGLSIGDLSERDIGPTSVVRDFQESHTYRFKSADWIDTAPSGFLTWPVDVTGTNSGIGNSTLLSAQNVNITLSGSDLTVTRSGAAPTSARSKDAKGAGKYYLEFVPNLWAGSGDCVGFANALTTTADIVTLGTNGAYLYRSGGEIWVNGAASGTSLGTVATGERIDAAIDITQRLVWFRKAGGNWNNSGSANPASGVGGISFNERGMTPCVGLGGSGSLTTHNVTANFGNSAFIGVVPDGFVGGWPVQGVVGAADYLWVGRIGG
jgi:hypothetical protein